MDTDNIISNDIFKSLYNLHPQAVNRIDIQKKHSISKDVFVEVTLNLNKFLKKNNFYIVGLKKKEVVDFNNCDKIFLIRKGPISFPPNFYDESDVENFKLKIKVFTVLFLEDDVVPYERFLYLIESFCSVDDLISLKKENYLMTFINPSDKIVYVGFNWRFYAEFKDFNPVECLFSD